MIVLRNVFERIVTALETVTEALAPSIGGTLERDYCPHCGEETEWHVNMLHRLYLCMQCKRNPKLSPTHYEVARLEAEAQGQAPRRPSEPAFERGDRGKVQGEEVVPA